MKIINIDAENLSEQRENLILLYDEFLASLGQSPQRSKEEKIQILETMSRCPSTGLLIAYHSSGAAVGSSYFNFGTGYSCGGTYLWLNGIYVRETYQGHGYGTTINKHIETLAKAKRATLFMSCRANENQASQLLFEKNGFAQESQTILSKTYPR